MSDPNAGLNDLEMMSQPERWPNWLEEAKTGILPLKHLEMFGKTGLGLLVARREPSGEFMYAWEWQASLFALDTPVVERVARGQQELLRLLVQAGWVVD